VERFLDCGYEVIGIDLADSAGAVERDGFRGRVADVRDPEAVAAAIEELLGDADALAAARAGARAARDALTWDGSAAAHLALYRELL
jgi:nucleoside-diphosphate-sugar epimerase